jgi:hypothetical protein
MPSAFLFIQQTKQKSIDNLAEMQKGIEDCKQKQAEVILKPHLFLLFQFDAHFSNSY